MRMQLTTLARVCDQYGVSEMSAAATVAEDLQGVVIVTEEDTTNLIDRTKIRRARQNNQTSLRQEIRSFSNIKDIYFDGRRDNTLYEEKF